MKKRTVKRKETLLRVNRVFTIPELAKVIPLLKGDRKQAMETAKANGIVSPCFVDALRQLVGYTEPRHDRYTPEQVQQIIDLFEANPNKSVYRIFMENKDSVCASDYQAMYRILKMNGYDVNRKRNFWTPIKDKRLIYMRDVQHLPWKDIVAYFGGESTGRTKGNVTLRYYKLKGKRTH